MNGRWQGILRGLRQPSWGLDRVLYRLLPRRSYAQWRFGSPDRCAAMLQSATRDARGPVFVFPAPSVAWGYLLQRPQQLALALARLGHTVLYAADPSFPDGPDRNVSGILQLHEGPILFADGREGRMISALKRPVICWQYWPHQSAFRQHLPAGSQLIYDCLDDLAVFDKPYPRMWQDHEQTLAAADVVLVSSSRLLGGIQTHRPDAVLVPNAATYEDFAQPRLGDWPELRKLRQSTPTLIGYFGALGRWLDWELLRELAGARPDWTWLLVGDLMFDGPPVARLLRCRNVHLWPRHPYARLGQLLASFDVATIPFKVDKLTEAVSPIKLFEYMAGGKPIVSTPLPECAKYAPVRVAGTTAQFLDGIEWALGPGRGEDHRQSLQACARQNTWSARVRGVLDLLAARGML
jgi:glycosyltransferase involved in cell wall biosynthesis